MSELETIISHVCAFFYLLLLSWTISKYIFHDEVSCSAMTHSFVEIFCRCIFVASFCISGLHSFWFWVEVAFNSSAFFTSLLQFSLIVFYSAKYVVLFYQKNLTCISHWCDVTEFMFCVVVRSSSGLTSK